MSSRLAITQNFEAPLAATNAGSQVQTHTASDFSQLIQQLTSESRSSDPLHTLPSRDRQGATPDQPMWGQGFGPAAGLPPGADLHVSPGSAGDLVAGVPAGSSPPQAQTDQSPEPTADEQIPAPPVKIAPAEQGMPLTAPRQHQKATASKTKEDAQTAPVVIAPPEPTSVPVTFKLPLHASRPANPELPDTKEASLTETGPRHAARADHEVMELRPPAALELAVREKDQPAPAPVEPAPPAHAPRTQQSAPAAEKSETKQSAGPSPSPHVTAVQPATPVQQTTPVATPVPTTQPHPAMAAPAPQMHYPQTTHSAPKSDTRPQSAVSHLDEMPEEPKQQPQALRSLSLEFTPDGAQDVRLRLAERAGDVHISLHSTDPALSGRLNDGVHDLVGNLSTAGYDAQAWTPEQGRQNNQRQFEDQRRGRRNPSSEKDSEEFSGLMQQPVQEVS